MNKEGINIPKGYIDLSRLKNLKFFTDETDGFSVIKLFDGNNTVCLYGNEESISGFLNQVDFALEDNKVKVFDSYEDFIRSTSNE